MDSNYEIISLIYLIGVLILILPGFLNKNSQFKTFLKNISIWVIIILILFQLIQLMME